MKDSIWENAIIKSIKELGGSANIQEIYKGVNEKIEYNPKIDFEHSVRGYLSRLKNIKKMLVQNSYSEYSIADSHSSKHKNYEILNLIGYGLSKFNDDFIKEFGFSTKTAFYDFCVKNKIAETIGTVKNRMDLFDHFFPENGRRGWWQKGNAYIHRKILIDSLFGDEDAKGYVNIVKLYMKESFHIEKIKYKENPIVKTRFKKLQETGLEAELFFMNNYNTINIFKNGTLEDARLYGDGYDFQVNVNERSYLAEIKGIREKKGKFRLTENEYQKALEYKNDYIITLILNLHDVPKILTIENPIKNLKFEEKFIKSKTIKEYHLVNAIC